MIRVLIVDDEETNIKLLKIVLKKTGRNFKIFEAKTGKEAIEKLKREIFDIVLLDILLPDINGRKVIPHIDKKTKVILITALEEEEVEKGKNIHFIQKPINIERFKNLILSLTKDEKDKKPTV